MRASRVRCELWTLRSGWVLVSELVTPTSTSYRSGRISPKPRPVSHAR